MSMKQLTDLIQLAEIIILTEAEYTRIIEECAAKLGLAGDDK